MARHRPFKSLCALSRVEFDGQAAMDLYAADACWNGGPADAFDTTGLRFHEVMDDGRLPVSGHLRCARRSEDLVGEIARPALPANSVVEVAGL
jgi:hypothetical protein